jgi:hypothetical protein
MASYQLIPFHTAGVLTELKAELTAYYFFAAHLLECCAA